MVDSTQATVSNRVKLYVNGVEETSFATDNRSNLGQNNTEAFGDDVEHAVAGRAESSTSEYSDLYIAETHFVNGSNLDATSFGETDEDSGIWKPKIYEGTYGTNGFYLKYNNTGNLGEDSSGNDNTFTPSNLSGTTDVTTDTPTNNFATLNALSAGTYPELREGNLQQYNHDTADSSGVASTFMPKAGKWYCELFLESPSAGDYPFFGITDQSQLNQKGTHGTKMAAGFEIDGATNNQGSTNLGTITNTNTGWSTFADNDIVMFALDCDNRKWWIGRNGTWTNSGDPAAGTNEQLSWTNTTEVCSFMLGYSGGGGGGDQSVWNFGQEGSFAGKTTAQGNADENGYGNFYYSPPSGYVALCTQNLATELSPTIDDGSEYFNTVLYTGTGTTQSITGVGFQPDWTWIKCRSVSRDHTLTDSTRGATKTLVSNTTGAETTDASGLTSFDSDGFTLGGANAFNGNTETHVSWNWLANGGTTSSNTDGSITSTVQANTTAGFSIVTYTGDGTASTIGHGLGVKPQVVILKNRSSATDWLYLTDVIDGSNDLLNLNQTGAKSDSGLAFTSTTFATGSGGGSGGSGSNYIAYCFAEIEGYSKFGKYTGNGSTDGTFVYTGFRPAFVIYKRTNATENWQVLDTKRDIDNPVGQQLYPNLSAAEGTENRLDFTSNGFKFRNSGTICNASGDTYIYMAFAENPFVTSGAVPVTAR